MLDKDQVVVPGLVQDEREARKRLTAKVMRLLEAEPADGSGLAAVEVPIAPVNPFRWLQAQPSGSRWFWSGRDETTSVAAVGVADEVVDTGDRNVWAGWIRRHLAARPGFRYYGGFRFDRSAPAAPEWAAFAGAHFVLPRFEVRRTGDETVLRCNLLLPDDRTRARDLLDQADRLVVPTPHFAGTMPLPVSRVNVPDEAGWQTNMAWALDAFERHTLGKIVLARKAVFGFSDPVDPFLLLRDLRAATPHCFHFLFQPAGTQAFIGASPERLFRLSGRHLVSEAVAGTRPRGDSARLDARLKNELLLSEKDQLEHEYVRRSIREHLDPLCETLDVEPHASLMDLARGRHLYSRVEGVVREGVSVLDLLEAMHPTPAVGGYPRRRAVPAIAELEPFDRGWYAGPIGWIGAGEAEFAVAIRSGLVDGDRLSLYSGAGIVQGSTPDGEWAEIEHKISDFIKVLGLDLRRTKY